VKQKIYIDTSVFGGFYDYEFAEHTQSRCSKELKTMNKSIERQFDAVKFMREQRDKLSKKLSGMTNAEIIEYFKKQKAITTTKPCA